MPSTIVDFEIRIKSNYLLNVYLSCSWRPDQGKNASWVIVRDLDDNRIRAVGDVKDQPEQDPNRILRIMEGCMGFVCVLPYRDNTYTTSEYIVQELSLAIQKGFPIALFVDRRIQLTTVEDPNNPEMVEIKLPNLDRSSLKMQLPLMVSKSALYGPHFYDTGTDRNMEDQLKFKISDFVETLKNKPLVKEPYALVFSRLKSDFQLARNAIQSAVEQHAGIPCLWINSEDRYNTNIDGIRERSRELLRHAEFVVVDLSRSAETPDSENATLAFELGQTDFAGIPMYVTLKRIANYEPYYAIENMQLHFWENEESLHRDLSNWIDARKTALSRYVYNRAKELSDFGYTQAIRDYKEFQYDPAKTYRLENLSNYERILIAASIFLIIFSGAQLFEAWFGFSGSYDLLAITASIIAFFFASFYSQIQITLARSKSAKYIIYGTAILFTVAFLLNRAVSS